MNVKVFRINSDEHKEEMCVDEAIEFVVNAWLDENPEITIKHVLQTAYAFHVGTTMEAMITIFFE